MKLIPITIFCLLQVCDLASTNMALKNKAIEANKFIAWLMGKIGVLPALVCTKIPMIALAIAAQYYYPSTYLLVAFSLASIWYLWVVINNFKLR